MPYADPEKRREASRRWRAEKMPQGYGKALYARRAARYKNEEILRQAMVDIRAVCYDSSVKEIFAIDEILQIAENAIETAPPIKSPIEYMPKEERMKRTM